MDKAWGYVLNAVDGDTFTLDVDSVSRDNKYDYSDVERVRVRGVDAPEVGERGGAMATSRLRASLVGRRVRIDIHARDKFGRLVADVDPNP
jgi:endonuclease YncB( thermonuclease family)